MKKRQRKKLRVGKPTVIKLKNGNEIIVLKAKDGRLYVFSDEVHLTSKGISFEAPA